MLWFTVSTLLLSLFVASTFALPEQILLPRAASDPCCKSCGPIAKVLSDCAATPNDVYCGCDQWVAAAPACEACIADSNYNSSFVVNPGPFLEFFWTWCQCKGECKTVAEAFSNVGACSPTNTDPNCRSEVLVKDGPGCLCCMEKVDPWFSSFFAVFIEQAKEQVAGKFVFPGTSISFYLTTLIVR
jgi:hypothetical protein